MNTELIDPVLLSPCEQHHRAQPCPLCRIDNLNSLVAKLTDLLDITNIDNARLTERLENRSDYIDLIQSRELAAEEAYQKKIGRLTAQLAQAEVCINDLLFVNDEQREMITALVDKYTDLYFFAWQALTGVNMDNQEVLAFAPLSALDGALRGHQEFASRYMDVEDTPLRERGEIHDFKELGY